MRVSISTRRLYRLGLALWAILALQPLRASPLFVQVNPASGSPGAVVTLTMAGLDANAPHTASINGTPGVINSLSPTQLVFTIGAGSTSGDLVVGENGINYTNPFPFEITRVVPGVFTPPPGINLQGYQVTAFRDSTNVSANGQFVVTIPSSRQTVVWAYRGEHDPVFLAVVPPQTNQFAIDARSTAAAWAFISPLIGTADETRGEAVMERLLLLPQTDALASRIISLCAGGTDYQDDARFESDLMAVFDGYLGNPVTLSRFRPLGFEPGTPSGAALKYLNPTNPPSPARKIKTQILPPTTSSPSYQMKFGSEQAYNPLDWLVEVYALDPGQFNNGLDSVDRLLPSDRPRKLSLQPVGSALVKAKLFSANFDVLGWVAGQLSDLIFGPSTNFDTVPLPPNKPGVYVSQAYSGNIFFGTRSLLAPPASQADTIDLLNADPQWQKALDGNLLIAGVDMLSVAVPVDVIFKDPGVEAKVLYSVGLDVSKALESTNKDSIKPDSLIELLKTITASTIKTAIAEALSSAKVALKPAFAATLKVFGTVFDVLGKYSSISQSLERFGAVAGSDTLALERSVAVIGTPWLPKVTSFFPRSGIGGDIVTIQGTRFDPDTNTLHVGLCRLGGTSDPDEVTTPLDFEIVSVSPGNIAARVPTNAFAMFPEGHAYIFIESGSNHLFGTSANLDPPASDFSIRDFPKITSVSPNPVLGLQSFELHGSDFDARAARDHQIVVDGSISAFAYAADETNLDVKLPQYLPPGSHTLTVTLRNYTTAPFAFQAQDPPYTVVPGQGYGISVTLNDFSDNTNDGQISILEAIEIARGVRQPRRHDTCEFLPPDDPSACPYVEREIDHVSGSGGGAGVADTIIFPNDMVIPGPLPPLSDRDRYVFGSTTNHAVILDGSSAGAGVDGIKLDGVSDVYFSGYLVVQNFNGNGVHLLNGANNNYFENLQIRNCGGNGIFLDGDAGFNEFRNTSISNVTLNGFYLSGANVHANVLSSTKGAYSGFGDPVPYDVIARCGGNGIRLDDGAHFNAIVPGTIRDCGGAGIFVADPGTRGNRFGRDDDLLGRSYDLVNNDGPGAFIGPGAAYNVFRYLNPIGNHGDGVLLGGAGCVNNVVDRTFAGLNRYAPGGALTIPNEGSGIRLTNGAQYNLIGTLSEGIGEHGTIVGNRDDGVLLEGTNTAFNTVNAQNIGIVDPYAFSYQYAANGRAAIALRGGAHDNIIGDPNLTIANTILASPVGIEIGGDHSDNNQVIGNLVGTAYVPPNWVVATGDGQNGTGIWIHDGPRGNIIGFPGTVTLVPRIPDDPYPDHYRTMNSIESCTNAGVLIGNASGQVAPDGALSGANIVQGNLIGELESGSVAFSGDTGIKLGAGAEANWIGGPSAEDGNRIRGWTRAGIWIDQNHLSSPGKRNRIQNNYIEGRSIVANQTDYLTQTPAAGTGVLVTDSSGQTIGESLQTANKLQFNRIGVYLGDSSSNTIRGFYITNNFNSGIAIHGGAANTLDGNLVHAIGLNGAPPWAAIALSETSGNVLRANEIGYLAPGRGSIGLYLTNTSDNTIGGAAAADGNQILDGVTNAVVLTGPYTFDNRLFNNRIGEDSDGNARPNHGDAVRIDNSAYDNFIGGEAQVRAGAALLNVPAGNQIAHNDGVGVRVIGAFTTGNRILYNSISDNTGKGISLEAGGNFNVPPPLMVKVDAFQATGIVTNLAIVPPGSIIQVFSNPILRRSDEGDQFVGEGVVASDGTWSAPLSAPGIPPFTMTATDTNGSTSEFGVGVTNFEAFQLVRTDNRSTDTAPDGAVRLPVLRLTAMASNVDVVVETLTLDASGSLSEPSGVAAVELFRDANGDGVVGAGDPQLGGPVTFTNDNGQIMFTNLNIPIAANSSQRWLLTYSLNAGATPGATFLLRVTDAHSVPSHLAAQFGVPVYPTGPFPLSSAQFTISGQPAQTFASWQKAKFNSSQLADPNVSGPGADPDGDGVINLLEYVFHLDPLVADANANTSLGAGLPVEGRMTLFVPELGGNRDFFTVTYVRLKSPGDLAYALQETPDFLGWIGEGQAPGDFALVSETDVPSDPAYEIMVVRSTAPLDGPEAEPKWFYRVRVAWLP